jgi:hypothetical protein
VAVKNGEEHVSAIAVDQQYLRHVAPRFEPVAGCPENLLSIAAGLRTATSITLVGAGSVTFTPPTPPMGYGNVNRILDLAGRQLAASGISKPTAEQLQSALMSVLTLRASGLDWGKIAQALTSAHVEIQSQPGMGTRSVS